MIHNSKEVRDFIILELKNNGIKKYGIKKTYEEIQIIKENILNKYKDKIEWLEIENYGTKYVIRVETRELKEENSDNRIKDIVSNYDAVVKKISVVNGVSLVNVNDYVKKGDILISGDIKLNDEVKANISSNGKVYGEVWYNVKVEYPFHYKEIKETGNNKDVYVLKFLNKNLEFSFNKYKDKKIEEKSIINYYPFELVKQKQREIEIIDDIYTEEEVVKKAEEKAKKQIEKSLSENEHIIYQKNLLIDIKNSKIILDIFFSVYKDIGIVKLREE